MELLHEERDTNRKAGGRVDYFTTIIAMIVFVENRLETGVEYGEMEKTTGFSLPHLRDIFRRVTGESLARYIMRRKITRAAFDILHSDNTMMDIAGRYGFSGPDTFTRAFRRHTGRNPGEFRKERPPMERALLCAGVFGVSLKRNNERMDPMNQKNEQYVSPGSVILYGVPKVHYGAFGGCTPFPICLKAVANYLGDDVAYEDAMALSGAAFRLVWDRTCWNGGNVDVCFTYDDNFSVYQNGIQALGHSFAMLDRYSKEKPCTKEDFIAFIREHIDQGRPVIALGIIGPPEACVITGYRDDGQTLLGWNCFQDNPEFAAGVTIDESGYFSTSSWWENKDTKIVMSAGAKTQEPYPLETVVKRAIQALEGRQHNEYAKGIAAYDAWKKALLDETQFPDGLVVPLQVERLMCQGDGMDCLSDGRSCAAKYFHKIAKAQPKLPLLKQIGEQFDQCALAAQRMYEVLGGWERGEAQFRALMEPATRQSLAALLDECKAADEQALMLMKDFISA